MLLGLFSVVTLMAHRLQQHAPEALQPRPCAWYAKSRATFSDALASVRAHLWQNSFCLSGRSTDRRKFKQSFVQDFADLLCYAQ